MSVNGQLYDATISHAIDLQQYSTGVVRRIIALLNQADSSLAAALADALERMPADSFTVEHMERLLASVRQINAAAYAVVSTELGVELKQLSAYEASYQLGLFQSVLPHVVQVHFPVAAITVDQVYAAAMSRPFQGRLLADWVATQESGRMAIIRNAIRVGYVEGKTASQIVRAIRGTADERYANGLLQTPRRHLMSVVQTAVSHTSAVAKDQFYDRNSDIIAAIEWLSTLDSKTSAECRIRDRLRYAVGTHKPIGHKVPYLQGPGKIHFCCRSTSMPVTKSWREIGLAADQVDAGTRASMDGQVPASMNYSEWLVRQSAARQDQVLGVERGRMLRSGKLKLEDFYSPNGQWLTLDQLRERDAELFVKLSA